jgi:hypothetical protein
MTGVVRVEEGNAQRLYSRGLFRLGRGTHHKTSHSFDSDLPETFASEDIGTNATEFALVGPQIGALLTDP